jgi:phosphatidylinositol glycan class B
MKSGLVLFLAILVFRIYNAIAIKTSFDPDEYWQSLEVAHETAFGYPLSLRILTC